MNILKIWCLHSTNFKLLIIIINYYCWPCSCWTLTASSNYTSNNLPHMQTQRLLVQFQAPNDWWCVARNMLSFI
jgi:hypothetical protein